MKLKKILCILTAFFCVMTLLAGCGGGDKKAADSKAKNEMKVMRVASSIAFAPFEFQDETQKEYQGFDMDLIRAIGKEMGVRVEIYNIIFDSLIPALEAGKVDVIISGMTINEARARQKKVLFSDPYYESGLTMVVAANNNNIETFKDLEGKKIAVQIGTTGAVEVGKIKDTKVIELDNPVACFMELKAGNVDAVVNDRPVNDYFISRGFKGVKSLPERLTAEDYGIAVSQKNPELQKKINAALKKLKENGEYQKIFDKWFADKNGQEINPDAILLTRALPLLIAGAGIVIEITVMSVVLGIVIGLLAGVAGVSRFKPLRTMVSCYVSFFRGTPLLVQIFVICFLLPLVTEQQVELIVVTVAACGINSGAYIAGIFRAGIQSIDDGQMDAGRSLGFSWLETMRYIIVPQAFRRVIPNLGNEFIALLKDSALVPIIGFEELAHRGQLIVARTYASFEIWACIALIYLAITILSSQLVDYLERGFALDDNQ